MCTEFQVYINREFTTDPVDSAVVEHQPDMTEIHDSLTSAVVIAHALRLGSTGDAVKTWQRALNLAGFTCPIDGDFGPKTKKLTEQFQTQLGLVADGVVGQGTLTASTEAAS